MQTPVFFSRPLTIGDLLDWTIRIYRARFGKLILTTAAFFVPLGIVSGIVSGQSMTGSLNIFMTLLQNPELVPDEQTFSTFQQSEGMIAFLWLVLMPLTLVAYGVVSIALTDQSLATVRQEEIAIGSGLRTGIRRFWGWVGMNLVIMLAVFGIMFALVMVLVLLGGAVAFLFAGSAIFSGLEGAGSEAIAIAGAFFAIICFYALFFILLFGPILYFYTRWSVALPSLVDQAIGPMDALRTSWALTKGNVWRALGYNLLIYLFYGVIYSVLMALGFGLSALVISSSTVASVVIFAIISALLPILWQPIQIAAHVMLYFDLRIRNESYDLELRIQQLEAEVAQDADTSV